jgi:LAO/AO transport system kinase
MTVSALQEDGLAAAWSEIVALADWRRAHGHWDFRRSAQARYWFEEAVREGVLAVLTRPGPARDALRSLGDAVAAGDMAPEAAARTMLARLAGADTAPPSLG